jgi:hypothetical protein
MATDERVAKFLQAEDEASRLVDELSRLRKETEAYSAAGRALEEAVHQLGTLVKEVSGAAGGVKEVATTLREIGTPALLRAQEALGGQISSAQKDIRGVKNTLLWALPVLFTAIAVLALLTIVK